MSTWPTDWMASDTVEIFALLAGGPPQSAAIMVLSCFPKDLEVVVAMGLGPGRFRGAGPDSVTYSTISSTAANVNPSFWHSL